MRNYYEIYGTIYYGDKIKTDHMTVNVWGDTDKEALQKAEEMIKGMVRSTGDLRTVVCQVSDVFPYTLEEFVYKALQKNHSGKRMRNQGVITLKDMNAYLSETYGIKNNYAKDITANIIFEKDMTGAVSYFKDFLGIRAEMFMEKFGLTEEQIADCERLGKLKFAYEERYGKRQIKYYKPDAYFQDNI